MKLLSLLIFLGLSATCLAVDPVTIIPKKVSIAPVVLRVDTVSLYTTDAVQWGQVTAFLLAHPVKAAPALSGNWLDYAISQLQREDYSPKTLLKYQGLMQRAAALETPAR